MKHTDPDWDRILLTPGGCKRIYAVTSASIDALRQNGVLGQTRDRMHAAMRRNDPNARDDWKQAESSGDKLLAKWAAAMDQVTDDLALMASSFGCIEASLNKILNDVWTETKNKAIDAHEDEHAFGGRMMAGFSQAMTTVPVELALGISRDRVRRLYRLRDIDNELSIRANPTDEQDLDDHLSDPAPATKDDKLLDTFQQRHGGTFGDLNNAAVRAEMLGDLTVYRSRVLGLEDHGGAIDQIGVDGERSTLLDVIKLASPRIPSEHGYAEDAVTTLIWSALQDHCLAKLKAEGPKSWWQAIDRFLEPYGKREAGTFPINDKWSAPFAKALASLRKCIADVMGIEIDTRDEQ